MIDQTHLSTLLSINTAGQIIFWRLSELSDGGAEFVRALMLASKRLVQLFGWPFRGARSEHRTAVARVDLDRASPGPTVTGEVEMMGFCRAPRLPSEPERGLSGSVWTLRRHSANTRCRLPVRTTPWSGSSTRSMSASAPSL